MFNKDDSSFYISADLQFVSSSCKPTITIANDGSVTIADHLTVDEAAREFWNAVLRLNPLLLRPAPAAPVEEMIRFCPECGHLGEIPAGYEACCPDWSHARVVPKCFADQCAETFRLCVSQPYATTSARSLEDVRADEAEHQRFRYWQNWFMNHVGRPMEPLDAWQVRAMFAAGVQSDSRSV
ncbi:hypothetical protein [Burkholderia cepacia]|uniref:hypothetical protein n=1 Tax=Burkholderia cepacia TaxID=292 RepID=UPI00196A6BDF|nr:hypothetical protein [Burkholderia cepacia]